MLSLLCTTLTQRGTQSTIHAHIWDACSYTFTVFTKDTYFALLSLLEIWDSEGGVHILEIKILQNKTLHILYLKQF